jgi:hypothetical protein
MGKINRINNRERATVNKRDKAVQIDFAKLASILLTDLTKNESKTYGSFTKDKLRTAIKNPKQNESTLREISQFLYRYSSQYKRLLKYQAEILTLDYNLIPVFDSDKKPDATKLMKSFNKASLLLQKMNVKHEFRKVLLTSWREDCFYGYIYETNDSFYIMPLDGKYCKISSVEDGVYNFAFDFTYFKGKDTYLDNWDSEFKSKYNTYQSQGNTMRWQELDPKKTICIKVNEENTDEVVPPLIGIFEELLDIIDYKSLMKSREELSNYKLIVQKIPLISNSTDVNDFAIDLDDALAFGDRLAEATPELVGVVTPMDIDTVEFKKDDATDINVVAQATNNMLTGGGYSNILWSGDKGGSVGLSASIITDEAMSLSVLKQVQRWVNRYIKYNVSGVMVSVKFHEMTIFNKDKYIERLTNSATLGLPVKGDLITAMGLTPLEMQGAIYFENEILKLHEILIPLSSSYTQSGSTGAPNKDPSQLTVEGQKSKDSNKNQDNIQT